MSEDKKTELKLPYEWAIQETLGPTLKSVGVDLESLYQKSKVGVSKIALAAKRKISDEKNLQANLRITRDVFWNGSFSEETICAEYFGGALSGSRSENGKDDGGIFYVDIIKSLSASQLLLHYFIYHSLNLLLIKEVDPASINIGLDSVTDRFKVHFVTSDLLSLGIKTDVDLIALHNKGLVKEYFTEPTTLSVNDKEYDIWVSRAQITTLGIQLYCVANADLKNWMKFPVKQYPDFPDIKFPSKSSLDKKDLINN